LDPGKRKTTLCVFHTGELESMVQHMQDAEFLFHSCSATQEASRHSRSPGANGVDPHKRPNLAKPVSPYYRISGKVQAYATFHEIVWIMSRELIHDQELGMVFCKFDGLDECDEEYDS
jgi:hypothetical protein